MTQTLLLETQPPAVSEPPLRILLVSSLYAPYRVGGAEVVAQDIAEAMLAAGHDVMVVSTETPEKLGDRPIAHDTVNGVQVARIYPKHLYPIQDQYDPTKPRPNTLKRALWHLRDTWNPDAGRKLGALLDEFRPDIVHTHNIDGISPIVWDEAERRGIPVVHTMHDLHLACPKATLIRKGDVLCENAPLPCQIYRSWYGRRARSVSRLCSPSAFLLDKHAEYGIQGQRSEVVRNGIPMPWLSDPVTRRKRAATDPLRVVYMGQLGRHKGLHTLLEAFERHLPRSRTLPAELHIAGAGPMEPEVRAAAESDPRITFHGFVRADAKRALLNRSDVFVIASTYYDNAPLSIIEAYGHGLPVIGAAIGGIPEMVRDNETGWLFEPENALLLASRLHGLALNPERIEEKRDAVRIEAQRYTVGAMVERYAQIYQEEIATVGSLRG